MNSHERRVARRAAAAVVDRHTQLMSYMASVETPAPARCRCPWWVRLLAWMGVVDAA